MLKYNCDKFIFLSIYTEGYYMITVSYGILIILCVADLTVEPVHPVEL